jgi:glycosyltransferase involved in cell wall biosynthesis
MSLVSIIVPVYNAEKYLDRCIDSILRQDYQDIELILVNDGSKDGSREIIDRYASEDSRVVAVHKENGGVSSTRNKGLELAKGEYIQFVDADDWLPFDATKLLVRAMEENDAEMVIGDFYRVVDDKVSKKGSINTPGLITRNLYADKMMLTPADLYYGVLWNKLYRHDLIREHDIKMDENISYCEDVIFNLEYLLHISRIQVLKAPVYYYVRTEGSLVMQNLNIQSTVKMKTSVIRYYNEFYKQILSEKDYESRKPIIYGYLLAVSTDSLNLPIIDSPQKLGEEGSGRIYYDEALEGSYLQFRYLSDSLMDRLLNETAQHHGMDMNEVRILYVLYRAKKDCTLDQIAAYSCLPVTACASALVKQAAARNIQISSVNLVNSESIAYGLTDSALSDDFRKAEEDFRAICYQGLSEEQISQYLEMKKTITDNIRKTVLGKPQS